MLRIGSAALTLIMAIGIGYYLGWEGRGYQVEALKAGIARAEAEAEAHAAEVNAQSMQDQLALAARERRLNARHEALQETINQQEFEGCTVPADIVERLNALDF